MLVVFDCFGVVYNDAFKDFLNSHARLLKAYAPDDYPGFYYELAKQIDMQVISDDEFYGTLHEASGVAANKIKALMRSTDGLNNDIITLIHVLKTRGHQIGLIAAADREFLQKFLEKNDQNGRTIGELFDFVGTTAEINDRKISAKMLNVMMQSICVDITQIVVIDDSEANTIAARALGSKAITFDGDTQTLETNLMTLLDEIM